MRIKDLKEAIANLPDDMPVAVNEAVSEATGLAGEVVVCVGVDDCPYDKGDNIYKRAEFARKYKDRGVLATITDDTKILFINTTG